jgi:hypothetical protein
MIVPSRFLRLELLSVRMTLSEFDCGQGLYREVKQFWTDGSETSVRGMERMMKWTDVHKGNPVEAMLTYACRPRTASKP